MRPHFPGRPGGPMFILGHPDTSGPRGSETMVGLLPEAGPPDTSVHARASARSAYAIRLEADGLGRKGLTGHFRPGQLVWVCGRPPHSPERRPPSSQPPLFRPRYNGNRVLGTVRMQGWARGQHA